MGCQGRACYDLISVIAGHYVNCTSRLQFLHHASSLLSWLVWAAGLTIYLMFLQSFILCREGQLRIKFFSAPLCFTFTLSHSHMQPGQSTTFCQQENTCVTGSTSMLVGVYCSFTFSTHTHGCQTGRPLAVDR